MYRRTTVFLALFSTFISGCSGPFDGTWLFQYDMASRQYETSCTDDSSVQYIGDQFQWVDMYSTTGGALVFTNGDYDLVGTVTGQSFEVAGTFGQMLGSSYYEWELEITGDLSGKDLTGDSNLKEITGDADGECRSQTQVTFDGVKMKAWDQPSRSIGTQSSQTATANE